MISEKFVELTPFTLKASEYYVNNFEIWVLPSGITPGDPNFRTMPLKRLRPIEQYVSVGQVVEEFETRLNLLKTQYCNLNLGKKIACYMTISDKTQARFKRYSSWISIKPQK